LSATAKQRLSRQLLWLEGLERQQGPNDDGHNSHLNLGFHLGFLVIVRKHAVDCELEWRRHRQSSCQLKDEPMRRIAWADLSILALLLTCTAHPLQGQSPIEQLFDQRPQKWERRDKPVLSAYTTQQSWSKVVIYSPHVIRHDGKFRMWYLGTSTASRSNDIALGYAESTDGLDWKEHSSNPILTAADVPWGRIWQTPFVMHDADEKIYKMWFVSGEGVVRDEKKQIIRNDQQLGYATSKDGIDWRVHPQPIYPSGRSPTIIKEAPDRYRMWMNSTPDHDKSGSLYTNIYEFDSKDGQNWTRGAKPVIQPSGVGTTTIYPFVIKEGDSFHMWYGCHTNRKFELFHAKSSDGSKWGIDHEKIAFPARAAKGFFDSRYTSTPCIVQLPDRYLLYYSARDMKTTFVDPQGKVGKDGAGIYAHIGVATLMKP
jgi:predicted GH43/DUF377 family glycosyl hydrolase